MQLDNLYLIGDKTHDRLHLLPTLVDGRPNPEAARLDAEAARGRSRPRRPSGGADGGCTPRAGWRCSTCSSSTGCCRRSTSSSAATSATRPPRTVTRRRRCGSPPARSATGSARSSTRRLGGDRRPADLAVLGYGQFLAQLEAGVAAHHAGMVPPFKEVVEACFTEGLVKVGVRHRDARRGDQHAGARPSSSRS